MEFWLCSSLYALHLSYATLVTYVPPFGAKQFQFPCRVIFDNSNQAGFNWFLLILQTAKHATQKWKLCCCSKDFFVYFFCVPYLTMAVSLKGTRRQPLVFHKGGINTLKQSWGAQHAKAFSTLKNFTKVAAVAADGGFS